MKTSESWLMRKWMIGRRIREVQSEYVERLQPEKS